MSAVAADAPVQIGGPSELSLAAKVIAFATMSVGFFIALLDIQIVAASLGEIGGGLSAGFVSMVGSTDIPGRRLPASGSPSSSAILTGMR